MISVETPQIYFPTPLTQPDITWIFMEILLTKQRAALDMLVAERQTGKPAFFHFIGDIIDGKQTIHLDWPSRVQDSQVVSHLLQTIRFHAHGALTASEIDNITRDLHQSPLFRALGSNTILVSQEQASQGNYFTPLDHVCRVAKCVPQVPLFKDDLEVAHLLPWLHDIGKMSGVNFLSSNEIENPHLREKLKEAYGSDGKHTHPGHAQMGAAITRRIFDTLQQSIAPEQTLNRDQLHLLLNVILHHHDFLYSGFKKQGLVDNWLKNEISQILLPTLPPDQPELIVRFFALLFQFRYADIAATRQHHCHWPNNLAWFKETPSIVSTFLPQTPEIECHLEILKQVIEALPQDFSQGNSLR